jgi:hypothetical protein
MRVLAGWAATASLLLGPVVSAAQEPPAARPAPAAKPALQRPAITRPAPPATTRPAPPATTRPVPPTTTKPAPPVVRPRPPVVRPPPPVVPPRPPVVVVPPPGPSYRPPGGGWDNGWGNNWNDWNGRIVRCESWNYRYARCNLDTRGGVRIVRVIAGKCRQGSSWGWDNRRNYVWVNNGCRGEFQSRYGSWGNSNGNNAGAVIGGVVVAAGLVAIIAAAGRSAEPASAAPAQMAAINIGPGAVPGPAEASFRQCTQEAARQIGATGGTAVRLLGAVDTAPGNGGWRFQIPFETSWPGDTRATPAICRATDSKVIELSFHQG